MTLGYVLSVRKKRKKRKPRTLLPPIPQEAALTFCLINGRGYGKVKIQDLRFCLSALSILLAQEPGF